jgi:uncharacterized protein
VTLFVDTSAIYALMDGDDPNHGDARKFWAELDPNEPLFTHNYVVVEASALVQRRLGIEALQDLVDELLLPITTLFVERTIHDAAVSAVLTARLRQLSVVDAVSFEVMRRAGVRTAFAFDDHFARFGFELLPT